MELRSLRRRFGLARDAIRGGVRELRDVRAFLASPFLDRDPNERTEKARRMEHLKRWKAILPDDMIEPSERRLPLSRDELPQNGPT